MPAPLDILKQLDAQAAPDQPAPSISADTVSSVAPALGAAGQLTPPQAQSSQSVLQQPPSSQASPSTGDPNKAILAALPNQGQPQPNQQFPPTGAPAAPQADTTGVADFFRKRGDQPITSGDDPRLATVTVGDQNWQVHKEAAPAFQGFLNDLSAVGAPVRSDGGWVYREKVGASGISEHAFGGAIDVNQDGRNEVSPQFRTWLKTNPGALSALEQKWNIYGGERFGDLGHFEWGGVPVNQNQVSSTVSVAAPAVGGTTTGAGGDVNQRPFFAPTGQQQPGQSFAVRATHYGYPGDPDMDPNSKQGIGAFNNQLSGGTSIALTPDLEQRFGAKPGDPFVFTDSNGTPHNFTFGDRTDKSLSGRIDIYDPTGQIGDLGDGTISRAGTVTSGPGQPLIAGTNTAAQSQPASFGMRVATPQDVANYNTYVQQGGDPNQIPMYDRLAVAIAKDPNFLTKPENFESFYGLVYKPLKAQDAGSQFNSAMNNLAPSIGQTVQNVGAAINNAVQGTIDQAKIAYRKATGQTGDPAYDALTTDMATRQATMSQGIGQGTSDAYNMVSNIFTSLTGMEQPIANWFVHDAAGRQQMDRDFAKNLQDVTRTQQQVAGLGKTLQNISATAYRSTGALADIGNKVATATPDEKAVLGTAVLANPLNVAPIAEGMAAVDAFKPLFVEKALQTGENLVGSVAAKGTIDAARVAPADLAQSAANVGYAEGMNLHGQYDPAAATATTAVNTGQNTLADQLTSLQKMAADPGTATSFIGRAMQATGGNLETLGNWAKAANDAPQMLARKMAGGNPLLEKGLEKGIEEGIFGGLIEALGPVGIGISAAREVLPGAASAFSDLLKAGGRELTYGETTLPYFTRVAQQTKLMPKGVASFLDSPAVQYATSAVKGGVTSAAIGAAQGALASPLDPMGGAVQGAAQGGIFGMAGGGFGQWQKFQNPNQYIIAARGDWKRTRDMLPQIERAQFDKLSSTNQLMLAQNAQHFPGLKTEYVSDPNGPRGLHYVDDAGRPTIQINLANPQSVVATTLAHELTHAATTSGMLPDIYDTMFGNPQRGLVGQYTQLGPDGTPVSTSPVTGRYSSNDAFAALKDQYISALKQSGIPTAHLTDLDIAKEIYAEHGVDYLLSGGGIQDANSAFRSGMYSEAALKTAQAKMGYTFDENGATKGFPGNVSGSGVFQNLQRNPELAELNEAYFRTRWKNQQINPEETPSWRFNRADMQNPNTSETFLRNASEILRNPDGTPMRDPNTGLPLYRTQREVNQYNAEVTNQLHQALSSLTDEQKAAIGYRETPSTKTPDGKIVPGNIFVRSLPDNVIDSLNRINQYNPHQGAALKLMSHILADPAGAGAEMRFFYHKALSGKGNYGQFEGTEKLTVPYGIEVTKDKNVNVKAVDFNQLTNNYLRMRNKGPFNTLWKSPDEFVQDAHTYFTNHSKSQPGAEGIGTTKRDAINALAGFGTNLHADSNPLVGSMPASVRSIIKDYRIDRSSGWSATGGMRPFLNEEQYRRMNANYMPAIAESTRFQPRGMGSEAVHPTASMPNGSLLHPETPRQAAGLSPGTHFMDIHGRRRMRP